MKTIKKFTYGGMTIGSYFGWFLPSIFNWNSTFFDKFGLSIIFGIFGVVAGYQLYKFFKRKF